MHWKYQTNSFTLFSIFLLFDFCKQSNQTNSVCTYIQAICRSQSLSEGKRVKQHLCCRAGEDRHLYKTGRAYRFSANLTTYPAVWQTDADHCWRELRKAMRSSESHRAWWEVHATCCQCRDQWEGHRCAPNPTPRTRVKHGGPLLLLQQNNNKPSKTEIPSRLNGMISSDTDPFNISNSQPWLVPFFLFS